LLNTAGYLCGGIPAWRDSGNSVEATSAIDISTLAERMRNEQTLIVDVRDDGEWDAGHVAGSIHAPFYRLRDAIPFEITNAPAGTRIAVACSAGNRSALAASHLRRAGIRNVDHVTDGGIPDLAHYGITLTTGAHA
jgi:hydroxyacylglutathione hydrolase